MDIEWGKDGTDGRLYILQARPETVKSRAGQGGRLEQRFKLKEQGTVLVEGRAIGQKIGTGMVRIVRDIADMDQVQPGDVLVTDMTDPNWEPVMKRASAIVTNRGGRTCHAAIIARELGIPAVVGCGEATDVLSDGRAGHGRLLGRRHGLRLRRRARDGDRGHRAQGAAVLADQDHDERRQPAARVRLRQMPNCGVGLARLEFIINNDIGVHPEGDPRLPERRLRSEAGRRVGGPRARLAARLLRRQPGRGHRHHRRGVLAEAGHRPPLRLQVNEYRKLIGGSRYEPEEENPMLGFRGASRYVSEAFGEAFAMECEALVRVRATWAQQRRGHGAVRADPRQAERVVVLLAQHGLRRAAAGGTDGLKLIMMCEVPSNAILADQFLEHFDGMSIGSNDLTQLVLGLDRDSGLDLLASDFDERDPAVKAMISRAIAACRATGKYIGICGQGPSDHPDFAEWLADEGIVSISLNPDSVVDTWERLAERRPVN
jgi:pyruvate,water dikinase